MTMLKIERGSESPGVVVFLLSGRLQGDEVSEVKKLLQTERQKIVLDLLDVKSVDRSSVRFLVECETTGIELRNPSPYIREWISREAAAQGLPPKQV